MEGDEKLVEVSVGEDKGELIDVDHSILLVVAVGGWKFDLR
jgi:hypothetical protein